MDSILNEIKKIRQESTLNLDLSNSNRYRVVVFNSDRTKTAYCFGAPIYNENTLKSVDFKFYNIRDKIIATGSNAMLDFTDKIIMKNREGKCSIFFGAQFTYDNDKSLFCGEKDKVHLTSNGIVYTGYLRNKKGVVFELETSKKFENALKNSGFYSLIHKKFRPYLTISCIGCFDNNGNVIAPAEIRYKQINEHKWKFMITPCVADCNYIKFEINLYEQKNFQDTTVESHKPSKRNAYGSIAFVGNTKWFGEQWLYIRPQLIPNIDLINKQTIYILMRLPKLNDNILPIVAFNTKRKFCSFGSRWENKVPPSKYIGKLSYDYDYLTLDITNIILGKSKNRVSILGGIIIKPTTNDINFIALATGDNYSTPPILEINYK